MRTIVHDHRIVSIRDGRAKVDSFVVLDVFLCHLPHAVWSRCATGVRLIVARPLALVLPTVGVARKNHAHDE
eukprot:4629996-Prymnesium_polylepis.3